ncbi:hypothetical protein LJB98_04695 [Bacteroidales bacterium OttesenSCG-928-M11]|nr:hypothetical protein [Bacteroidales bacterium OttesenSCG-928-M11]
MGVVYIREVGKKALISQSLENWLYLQILNFYMYTDMNDEQRIKRIDELWREISPLHLDKSILSTTLYFLKQDKKEGYEKKVAEKEKNIYEIEAKLTPLMNELRELQCRYWIIYEVNFSNPRTETFAETFHLKADCSNELIKTFNRTNPSFQMLLGEVNLNLYHRFGSSYNIINIERLD